jgi:hypothetical protein
VWQISPFDCLHKTIAQFRTCGKGANCCSTDLAPCRSGELLASVTRGVAGLVTKPLGGTLDLISKASEGLRNSLEGEQPLDDTLQYVPRVLSASPLDLLCAGIPLAILFSKYDR